MHSLRHQQVIAAAEGALALIPQAERPDAEKLIQLCRQVWLDSAEDPGNWRKELGRLIEVLARRSAQAMPFAALGRAVLADLHNDSKMSLSLLNEFEIKLSSLGL